MNNEDYNMTDYQEMAMEAVKVLIGQIGTPLFKNLVGWMRNRLSRETVDASERLADRPDDCRGKEQLEAMIKLELERAPALANELKELLSPIRIRYSAQSGTISGSGIVVQIQGNQNQTEFSGKQ